MEPPKVFEQRAIDTSSEKVAGDGAFDKVCNGDVLIFLFNLLTPFKYLSL